MNTINFRSVLPQVFAQRDDLHSEIWSQDVSFEKGHLYLVEADSGKGKSTFAVMWLAIVTIIAAA